MNVVAEGLEKARALMPGLFKFYEDGPFFQAVLAANEEMLYVYNDHAPDMVNGDSLNYQVKVRFPKESIDTIFNEIIYKQPDLKGLNRLSIMTRDENVYFFYYFSKDKKAIGHFISSLKHLRYSVESHKTNLNY